MFVTTYTGTPHVNNREEETYPGSFQFFAAPVSSDKEPMFCTDDQAHSLLWAQTLQGADGKF